MDDALKKPANVVANEIPSPILLRRRLSAPETIMRKHSLAQQRSESQDSELTQAEARSCQWHGEPEAAGSDPNLCRKRDSGLMRKSTLLRRLWSSSKPTGGGRFAGSFCEWQHYGKMALGKSAHSLNSGHSSPEHHLARSQSRRSLNSEFRTSPKHQAADSRRPPPNNINLSPKRKVSVLNGNFNCPSDQSTATTTTTTDQAPTTSTTNNRTSSMTTSKTTTTTTTITDTDFVRNSTNASYTTFSDHSDSAFTNNTRSNYSQNSNNNNYNSTASSDNIQKRIVPEADQSNLDTNEPLRIEGSNSNSINNNEQEEPSTSSTQFIKYSSDVNETSTQTSETTNFNVISNVHLSQSTLDLIFNQVMQDVHKSAPQTTTSTKTMPDSTIINVQQVPSFFLKQKQDIEVDNPEHSRIVKYMISNVGTGSPYSKPAEVPQVVVPRFSALPRTTSMEVNISSGESTDKESDSVSLVDSLEDPSSLRGEQLGHFDERASRDDLSLLLPDNSAKKDRPQKPAAFFIPLSNTSSFNAVSDHLPDKVKKKLAKRQKKREEKLQLAKSGCSSRSDSNYISASDNGNGHYMVDYTNLNVAEGSQHGIQPKKRTRPLLPSIEAFRKFKIDKKTDNGREPNKPNKSVKRKSATTDGKMRWLPKSRNKATTAEKLTPLYSTKNEYVYDDGPRRIYHKTEFNNSNKHIEILEIMECIDAADKLHHQLSKGKSRIPVLVNQKLPKIGTPSAKEKPTYLDFDTIQINDPKLDQLIANILIETLNNPNINVVKSPGEKRKASGKNVNEVKTSPPLKHSPPAKYQQKFEVIPEELSLQASNEEVRNCDSCNNNNNNNNAEEASTSNSNEKGIYKGKAAVAVVRDENFSSIPKGWITFYMLHKNQGSPDSTSDEGKQLDNTKNTECLIENNKYPDLEIGRCRTTNCQNDTAIRLANKPEGVGDNLSSSSEQAGRALPPPNDRRRKSSYQQQRKPKQQRPSADMFGHAGGEWSVTVSGTNPPHGQFGPELEMRLKFPPPNRTGHCPSQSDSGLGEDEKRTRFPRIDAKPRIRQPPPPPPPLEEGSDDSYPSHRLPEITRRLARKQKRSDSSIPLGTAGNATTVEPRQTRTSTQRYSLSHPRIEYCVDNSTNAALTLLHERHYAEILRRFPEILRITGNAISPERKPRVPTMTERDLTRNYYSTPR